MTNFFDHQLADLARTLARMQTQPGYLALCAVGHHGAGRTSAPYETTVLLTPTLDMDAALHRAWETDVREVVASYVARHALERGVVGVRVMVALAAAEEPGYWLQVHASDVGVRQVGRPMVEARRPFSVVQGGRS
ncbi:hypothetical protein [Aureimonas sp. AU40]|uniref:hypothetical protein n=1 Tax=Aureimonas sp. AU40 TaxID=1637747 RepID=UPI000785DBE1|nr:hypothetical protein [Aureimonas sp. AU40]